MKVRADMNVRRNAVQYVQISLSWTSHFAAVAEWGCLDGLGMEAKSRWRKKKNTLSSTNIIIKFATVAAAAAAAVVLFLPPSPLSIFHPPPSTKKQHIYTVAEHTNTIPTHTVDSVYILNWQMHRVCYLHQITSVQPVTHPANHSNASKTCAGRKSFLFTFSLFRLTALLSLVLSFSFFFSLYATTLCIKIGVPQMH